MTDIKISDLAPATTPLSGTEIVPIVQSGVTVQTSTQSIADLGGGGGTLAGDVTGPLGTNVVAFVGGQTAANIALATIAALAATATNTASTIMKRDSGGSVGATNFVGALIGNADTATLAANATNAVTAVNFSGSLAGDVTGTQAATTIAGHAVTNAKLAQMATHTIKGNATGGTADAADLTGTQVTALLDNFTDLLKGLVPPSGGGTVNFLRADGTWTTGAGGVSNVNGQTGSVSLTTTDIPEGTNLYYTNARVLGYATAAAASNSVVARDGFASSSFGAVTATTLTGNLSNTSTLDTVPIATVLAGAAAGNSATASPTSNTIAKRDGFGALVATAFSGGDLAGNAQNVNGIVAIANGGTGQSNQQAGLNNITNIAGATDGDYLQFTGGNAQFAPLTITYAAINTALGLPSNCFVFSNAASEVVGYGEWAVDPTVHSLNAQLFYQPNNLGVGYTLFNWNVNVDPLQNSPNDTVTVHNISANLDSAATGFNLGDSGDAVHLINGGLQYNGNGGTYGRLRTLNLFSGLGNGTDPFNFKGFSASSMGLTTNANVTIDGQCTGYDYNLNINAASISTSNFSSTFLSDFSVIPIDLYGYQGLVIQPNISKIKNNTNFTALNINPTIADLEGNAGFYGLALGGTITNLGASNGYQGIQVNSTITHLTQGSTGIYIGCQTTDGTANWQGINLNTSNIVTTGEVKALNISTSDGHIAIDSQGHNNLQCGFDLVSGQGQMYGNVIGGEIRMPNGTAITGTDVLANNMAFGVNTGDAGSAWTAASLVGLTTLGFVGQIVGAGTVNGAINFCLNGFADAHTGHIDTINNFYAAAIPTGAGGTVDDHVLYYGDMPAGGIATNEWGLRIDDSATIGLNNFLTRLALSTVNKKSSSANVLLDVFNGHIAVGQTTAPTIAVDANAGTGATASVSGTDTAGAIQLDTGTLLWAAGAQATVTFNLAFASAPKVVLTATNANAAAAVVGVYVTKTTTTLVINFAVADASATTYTWDYHCYETT